MKILSFLESILRNLWSSATFTEWCVKLVRPLRLLLVTPLLITQFSETEIAAWYLFASINFLGVIVTTRVSLTLSRMISMAVGGGADLSPINKAVNSSQSSPNWPAILKVYRCMGLLQLGVVFLTVGSASIIGAITLANLVSGEAEAQPIFLAFWIMQGSNLLFGVFGHFPVTLRGLGHVALVNRWASISALLSVVGGVLVLTSGGGIVALTTTMQALLGLVLLRNWWLIRTVNQGALKVAGSPRWDAQVWSWARAPLWKGFLGQFSTQGVTQISALIFSFYATTSSLASFLFSLSIMRALVEFTMTPFSSQQPRFTRLMSGGKLEELRVSVSKRVVICQILFVGGVFGIGLMGPWALDLIGANAHLLGLGAWFTLGGIFLYERFNTFNLAICAAGNNIQMYWHLLAAGICSLGLFWFLIPLWGVWGVFTALFVPKLAILNWQTAGVAARQLDCSLKCWMGFLMMKKFN